MIGEKIIGLDITEQAYRDLDNMSYSLLSSISRESHYAINKKFRPSDSTKFGVLVEDMLFDDYVEDDYHVMSDIFSSETKLKKACDDIFDYLIESVDKLEPSLSKYLGQIEKFLANEQIDYYENKDVAWRAAKIVNDLDAKRYWGEFVKGIDKITVTQSMIDDAKTASNTLKQHEFTRGIFSTNTFQDIEKFSQVKILFEYRGYQMKAMLDFLIINHDEKLIQPYDLKTGGDHAERFEKSYFFWRYDIQAYLYMRAVSELLKDKYPGYKLEMFKFVYISRNNVYRPLIWKVSPKLLKATREGFFRDGKYYKSIEELINDYLWYKEDENRIYPKEIYDSKGEVAIDDSNIEIRDE